jgi:hypothetical protein
VAVATAISAFAVSGAIGLASFCGIAAFSFRNWTAYGLCEGTNAPQEVFFGNGLLFVGPVLLLTYILRRLIWRDRRDTESGLPEHWKDRK